MGFSVSMPAWSASARAEFGAEMPAIEDRMRMVIRFARLNVEHETGGPFAAGVFESVSGRLVAIGVNRVVASDCSSAHAEIVALSMAQQQLGTFDLGANGLPSHQLVVNWRPCAMCCGAVVWSGVRELVIAGSGPALEDITGFDEGPRHPGWKGELGGRGIAVIDDVLGEEACAVFRQFRDSGALVYNGRAALARNGGAGDPA